MTHDRPITFGKYKGVPISEVPVDYLVWALESIRNTPIAVVEELERRGSQMSGGAAFIAQASLGKWKHSRAVKKARRCSGPRSAASPARRRDVQRQVASEKLRSLSCGIRITGDCYREAREEWEVGGGDLSSCPFGDADESDAMRHLRAIAGGE